MKKSILLGCIAACALTATTSFAEVIKPTSEEIKAAFTEYLNTQNKIGALFDLDKMQVTPAGDGFDIVVPASQNDQVKISEKAFHLTAAGDFNNRAQYKIETPFESFQSLFEDVVPDAKLTTESAAMTMVWVPAYNLVSKDSQNIKGLKLSIPGMMNVSVGSLVSDSLARVASADKMDAADSTDGHDIQISAENAVIVVPSFSYESVLLGSNITPDPFEQMASCDLNTFKYTFPDVQLKMQGASAPIASFSMTGSGSYKNEILHFENIFGNIASPTLGAFAPAELVPDEISVNLDIEGISKALLSQLSQKMQSGNYTDEDVPALKQAISAGVIKINRLEVKNTMAGIALSGTIRGKLDNPETVTTLAGLQENLEPVIEAKVVITNLDKISPEPVVDQAQCDRATERLKAVDEAAPDADAQKEMLELQQEMACTPQGGSLDFVRPYLDMTGRVVNTDGTTLDTLVITFEDDVLTINGKQVQ